MICFSSKVCLNEDVNSPTTMTFRKSALDNFSRFLMDNTEESQQIEEIKKAISSIPDTDLQTRIYQRINVELGVILLRKAEIQEELSKIFETEFPMK